MIKRLFFAIFDAYDAVRIAYYRRTMHRRMKREGSALHRLAFPEMYKAGE